MLVYQFFRGFKIQDINDYAFGCLWEQHRTRREFSYTDTAFNIDDPAKQHEMFPEWRDRVFNVTQTISNEMSQMYYDCTFTVWDSYTWAIAYWDSFQRPGYYSYGISVL